MPLRARPDSIKSDTEGASGILEPFGEVAPLLLHVCQCRIVGGSIFPVHFVH